MVAAFDAVCGHRSSGHSDRRGGRNSQRQRQRAATDNDEVVLHGEFRVIVFISRVINICRMYKRENNSGTRRCLFSEYLDIIGDANVRDTHLPGNRQILSSLFLLPE